MAATSSSELLDETKCYACYGLSIAQLLNLGLLRRTLLSVVPTADVSGSGLLAYAKCYACFGCSIYEMLELAMLDQISQS